MKELLALKEQYKKLVGSEYKPPNTSASASSQKENKKPVSDVAVAAAAASSTSDETEKLAEQITKQGDKVRELKSNKSASKVGQIVMKLHFRELAISSDNF